jgi:hypothetical protein
MNKSKSAADQRIIYDFMDKIRRFNGAFDGEMGGGMLNFICHDGFNYSVKFMNKIININFSVKDVDDNRIKDI